MDTNLSVWTSPLPGDEPRIVAMCDSIEAARSIAEKYRHRRDLKWQDVYIRLGQDGKITEYCGPSR